MNLTVKSKKNQGQSKTELDPRKESALRATMEMPKDVARLLFVGWTDFEENPDCTTYHQFR